MPRRDCVVVINIIERKNVRLLTILSTNGPINSPTNQKLFRILYVYVLRMFMERFTALLGLFVKH